MVSETRKILEQQFAAARENNNDEARLDGATHAEAFAPTADDVVEENSYSENSLADKDEVVRVSSNISEENLYDLPPKSFNPELSETYKSLAPEMKKYLHEKEKSFSQLCDEMQKCRWIDDVFQARADRMSKRGIASSRDWIEMMAKVDDALERNPFLTLQTMADCYGFNIQPKNSAVPYNNGQAAFAQPQDNLFWQSLNGKIKSLEDDYGAFKQTLFDNAVARSRAQLQTFINERDDNGNLKHPYLSEVQGIMLKLLEGKLANGFDEAYNQAVWLKDDVRQKLILEKSHQQIQAKSQEAQKAKSAGFSPIAKPAELPDEELTTRQLLEKKIYGF